MQMTYEQVKAVALYLRGVKDPCEVCDGWGNIPPAGAARGLTPRGPYRLCTACQGLGDRSARPPPPARLESPEGTFTR